ncbi:glucan endo-1,3-beta-glucosidase 7 [Artemisia annua]|uniref:Glucan endo-1,3-beta-glucosidase 7 n=1 Tax=Artemisia annua TaxID=35608 RepID=A0A2U1KDP7_ARTAN|nr:glucan endo-1,3-beta-glucosidase 7 [Artemisia annua]
MKWGRTYLHVIQVMVVDHCSKFKDMRILQQLKGHKGDHICNVRNIHVFVGTTNIGILDDCRCNFVSNDLIYNFILVKLQHFCWYYKYWKEGCHSWLGEATPTTPTTPVTPSPVQATGWCVPKQGVSDAKLQSNLDYVCSKGLDCGPLQPGGACFEPNTVISHASYAMDLLYETANISKQQRSSSTYRSNNWLIHLFQKHIRIGLWFFFDCASSQQLTANSADPGCSQPTARTPLLCIQAIFLNLSTFLCDFQAKNDPITPDNVIPHEDIKDNGLFFSPWAIILYMGHFETISSTPTTPTIPVTPSPVQATGCKGLDCGPLQPGGACFEPNTVISHATYAMNLLYETAASQQLTANSADPGCSQPTARTPLLCIQAIFLNLSTFICDFQAKNDPITPDNVIPHEDIKDAHGLILWSWISSNILKMKSRAHYKVLTLRFDIYIIRLSVNRTMDFSSLLGPLFCTWVTLKLFPERKAKDGLLSGILDFCFVFMFSSHKCGKLCIEVGQKQLRMLNTSKERLVDEVNHLFQGR